MALPMEPESTSRQGEAGGRRSPTGKGGPASFSALRDEDVEELARVGRDTGLMLGGSGFGRFLGLAFNFLTARVAGEALFGLYTLTQTVVNYLVALANFGLDQAVVRFAAIHRGTGDEPRLKGVVLQGLAVNASLGLLGGAGLYLLAPRISVSLFHKPELTVFLKWVALAVPFIALLNIFFGITQGLRLMKHTPLIRDLGYPVLKLVVAVALFAAGMRAGAIIGAQVSTAVVWGLASLGILFQVLRPLLAGRRAVFERGLIGFGFPLFLNDFVLKSFRWSDVLFLGLFRGSADIGVYRIAQITSEISRIIYQSFKTTFAPVISLLHHRGEKETLRRQYVITSKWAFAVSFPPLRCFSSRSAPPPSMASTDSPSPGAMFIFRGAVASMAAAPATVTVTARSWVPIAIDAGALTATVRGAAVHRSSSGSPRYAVMKFDQR